MYLSQASITLNHPHKSIRDVTLDPFVQNLKNGMHNIHLQHAATEGRRSLGTSDGVVSHDGNTLYENEQKLSEHLRSTLPQLNHKDGKLGVQWRRSEQRYEIPDDDQPLNYSLKKMNSTTTLLNTTKLNESGRSHNIE